MEIHIIYTVLCILTLACSSCSCRKNLHCPATGPACHLILPDSLTNKRIDFSFYRPLPARCYAPPIMVKDSFSSIEKQMIGIQDKDLFARRSEIILDLDTLSWDRFHFPLPQARLLSPYGRRHGRMHTGMDLKISRRDTVFAVFDGIVRKAGKSRGYGNVIVIRHYNGLETVYAHNSKHLVHSGDQVTSGMPISITGQTGRATTDHLHFEIRMNGQPLDPRTLIDFKHQKPQSRHLSFSLTPKGRIKIEDI